MCVGVLAISNNKNQAEELLNIVDGLIVGIKGLSTVMSSNFSIDDIEELSNIAKNKKKEIFILLNKNIHSCDLTFLEEVMIKLEEYSIKRIIFYDIAVVNIKNRLNLKTDLVWAQEHLTTNALASNFWFENGVKYTWISSDITKEEIEEIRDNTSSKLMLTMFGHIPMFTSNRELITNYKETFNIKDNSEMYYFAQDDYYPITQDDGCTYALSSKVINGIKESLNLKLDCIVLNSFLIDDSDFKEVSEMFMKRSKSNIIEYSEKLDSMFDTNTGFLYKETTYKVKNDV